MKPFNLKEYLENPSRKVVTRNGCNVNIVCADMWYTNRPIVALVETQYSSGLRMTFTKDGEFFNFNVSSKFDLFFKEES